MIKLDRLIGGTSGMHRNVRVLPPLPRSSTGPGRLAGGGEGEGGGTEDGTDSRGRRANRDVGITRGPGSPVGKSGIGAPIGAPGMGLRVMAMPRGGRAAI